MCYNLKMISELLRTFGRVLIIILILSSAIIKLQNPREYK